MDSDENVKRIKSKESRAEQLVVSLIPIKAEGTREERKRPWTFSVAFINSLEVTHLGMDECELIKADSLSVLGCCLIMTCVNKIAIN